MHNNNTHIDSHNKATQTYITWYHIHKQVHILYRQNHYKQMSSNKNCGKQWDMIIDDDDDDGMYDGANITLCMLAGMAIVSVCICQAHPSLCFFTMSPEPLLLPFAISTKLSQMAHTIFLQWIHICLTFFLLFFRADTTFTIQCKIVREAFELDL